MTPDVLVDSDRGDRVEAAIIGDQESVPFGQDGGVGGVPGHCEALRDPGDREVLQDQALQLPAQAPAADLREWFASGRGVLAPDTTAARVLVAENREREGGWAPTEWLVRERSSDTFARCAPAQPQRRHQTSDSVTVQASTARSGSRRCPMISKPSSSKRANMVKSGRVKVVTLLCLSSDERCGRDRVRGGLVGSARNRQCTMDLSGEVALEDAADLAPREPFSDSSLDVGLRLRNVRREDR